MGGVGRARRLRLAQVADGMLRCGQTAPLELEAFSRVPLAAQR